MGWCAAAAATGADGATTGTLPLGRGTGVVFMAAIDNRAIGPVTAEYMQGVLAEASRARAECLIVRLDTPGGLLESTRLIVGGLLNADVPVVVWVAPPGARAASAGMFLTLAAHVAAMAPATHIGAAHPVTLGGSPEQPPREREEEEDPVVRELRRAVERRLLSGRDEPTSPVSSGGGEEGRRRPAGSPEMDKVLNDTAAWARNIAERRGRNAQWAELAVRASEAVTEKQALALGVVDLVAESEHELLEALHGRTAVLAGGERVRLATRGAVIERRPMSWRQRMLDVIVQPQICVMLLLLGFLGLLYEVTHPGIGVPGVAGAIMLILGLYAVQMLPVNLAGLLLIGLALAMFVAEAKVVSYGLLTGGGLLCLVLGALLLIREPAPFTGGISMNVIVPVAVGTAAITIGLMTLVLRSHRTRVLTGAEGMVGAVGVAVTDLAPRGRIEIGNETWSAVSTSPVRKGERVVVKRVKGLVCEVVPAEKGDGE
ncbi:MAG: nodulation protein NfeD [Candidatus Sumerlaeia bacterium]